MNSSLYILVRNDLPTGLQMAQACHAMSVFAHEHPAIYKEWFDASNNLVVLAVPSIKKLQAWQAAAGARNFPTSSFQEPDLGDQLTAIAAMPDDRRFFSALPCAGKRVPPLDRRALT